MFRYKTPLTFNLTSVRGLVLELDDAGLLADFGLEEVGDGICGGGAGGVGGGGVETIEDEEVALGVVHDGEVGDALEMVRGARASILSSSTWFQVTNQPGR